MKPFPKLHLKVHVALEWSSHQQKKLCKMLQVLVKISHFVDKMFTMFLYKDW